MPRTESDDVTGLLAEDSESLGYNQHYGATENTDVTNNNGAVTSEEEQISRRMRLTKTVCMLGIYLGLVRILIKFCWF